MKLGRAVVCSTILACGCSDSAAPLPACSAAIPGTPTASKTLDGASACTEVGAVMLAATGDLSVEGYKALGPAFTASGTGPFPHGIDFVLPYDPTQVKDSLQNQIVVLAKRGTAAAHNAL